MKHKNERTWIRRTMAWVLAVAMILGGILWVSAEEQLPEETQLPTESTQLPTQPPTEPEETQPEETQPEATAAPDSGAPESEISTYAGGYGGGGTGGGTGGNGDNTVDGTYTLSQSNYRSDSSVYWDVAVNNNGSWSGYSGTASQRVTAVNLNNQAVTWADSDGSSWSGGKKLSTYYPSATTEVTETKTLSITPAAGYYIKRIVVACCTPGPYACRTWNAEHAFEREFKLHEGMEVSIDLPSYAFGHSSRSGNYFILIVVAPIPTPLYVEYDYGDIVDYGADDAVFADPGLWTAAGANDYGQGKVDTAYTQFQYAYNAGSPEEAADWVHTANTVTEAAKAAAASAGYYFTGWQAQYYETVTVSGGTGGNNFTYTFSDYYSQNTYAAGESVSLITNVRLTAQWAPIRLTVTKTVEGLSDITEHNGAHTYYLMLYKDGELLTTIPYTITGDGSQSYTLSAFGDDLEVPIAPGSYWVVEQGSYDWYGESTIAQCTVTCVPETVTVSADGTVKNLQLINHYTSTPATRNLTVIKTVSGNMSNPEQLFSFTVAYNDATYTYELSHGHSTGSIAVPVGAVVTVSEDAQGYTFSVDSVTSGVVYTKNGDSITFTMPTFDVAVTVENRHEVNIDTGVVLSSGPEVLILALAAVGAALTYRRRRTEE